jgi:outer membrane protein OmpA-like peptidoglycan-associated protein
MKTWVIGIGVLLLWSAGSTYWYVCKIKGQCWTGNATVETPTNNAVATDPVDDSAPANPPVDTAAAEKVVVAAAIPADLLEPHTVLFVFAGGPRPDDPQAFEAYLDALAAHLKAHPTQKALLRGYTDDTAARENNVKLAQRRCDVIAAKLTERGLAATQIITEPLGERDPVATNDTEAGRRLNRRVVISIQQ